MSNNNIQLFPARISSRVVRASEIKPGKGAAGGYQPVEDRVVIPASDSAYARTIRLHEAGHAIWSRKSMLDVNDYVSQAVEDAKIHGKLETSGSARRDEVYAALVDLRNTEARVNSGATDRALQGLMLLRSASILRKSNSSKLGAAKLAKLTSKFHPQGVELVNSILAEIDAGNIEAAKALCSKLFTGSLADTSPSMESPEDGESQEGDGDGQDQDGDGEEGDGDDQDQDGDQKQGNGKPSNSKSDKPSNGKPLNAQPSDGFSGKPSVLSDNPFTGKSTLKADKQDDIPDSIKGNVKDYIPKPVVKMEKIHEIEGNRHDHEDGTIQVITGAEPGEMIKYGGMGIPYPPMYVHTLSPNVTRRVRGRGRSEWKSTSQGLKIRVNRLALNAANPCGGSRLFQNRNLGGTVLLDASGSMDISDSTLYEIAEKFPAGKVAYYSGVVDGWPGTYVLDDPEIMKDTRYREHYEKEYALSGYTREQHMESWSGNLVIYAQNGKIRKDRGENGLPKRDGGNLVDYQAILWLLKQPGPRYIMTDRKFTGPLALRAMQLLREAENQKKVTVYRSVEDLMEAVKKLR